ncbi:MAG: HAD family hydrolase [Patescibacteria group bacterium]|nr:HAD family hydrolase [Patescibacteria group bacterium]
MKVQNDTYKQHFVFDLDETLIDARDFSSETIARVVTKIDPDINPQNVIDLHDKYAGSTIRDHYRRMIKEFGLMTSVERMLLLDQKIQKDESYRASLFEGVIDILDFLKNRGKTLHICTNRSKDTLEAFLKKTRISGYFETIISCVDEGYKKPDPKCLLDLISSQKLKKEELIYFGDSEIDRDFAKNADIDFVIFDQYLNDKRIFKKLINLFLEESVNKKKTPPFVLLLFSSFGHSILKLTNKFRGKQVTLFPKQAIDLS